VGSSSALAPAGLYSTWAMYGPEKVVGGLDVLADVGIGKLVGGDVGDIVGRAVVVGGAVVVGRAVVGLGTGVGVAVSIDCWVLLGAAGATGVEVRGAASSASVAAGVRGAACVGLGVRRDVDTLLQAYDNNEQHVQIMQAMKKRIT
ncbi:MAG: hypothetical protein V3S14_03315, partial [Anaerolineae bacterium]